MARAAGNARREQAFAGSRRRIADADVVIAAAMSERGQNLTRPATTAVRTEAGWRIDGTKVFCTMAPAATVLLTSVRFATDDGERFGYVEIAADAPGVRINDDWDALGMRASGSHSVTFDGVELAAGALRGGFPVGSTAPFLERNLPSGLFHALGRDGELVHREGVTAAPGLFALGLRFQRTRASHLLGGVGADAARIAAAITARTHQVRVSRAA
jgi:alkylation response protein AidB-like acyl-CoA dehydrogenase